MDRPSVSFKEWGTVGHDSIYRRLIPDPRVPLRVFAPPEGPAEALYEPYISADLADGDVRRTMVEGLRNSTPFAAKFVQPSADYGDCGKGAEILCALNADDALTRAALDLEVRPPRFFSVDDHDDRRRTLALLIAEASILLTSAVAVSEESGFVPVTDDPYFARLISHRLGTKGFVGEVNTAAPMVGIEIMRTVVPDEALSKLEIEAILEFRGRTRDAYSAWSMEINKLAARLDEMASDGVVDEVPRIVASEIALRMLDYRNEMKSIRDKMWGGIISDVVKWEMPSLGLAFRGDTSIAAILASFGVTRAIPRIIDYYVARKDLGRRRPMGYLVQLVESAKD